MSTLRAIVPSFSTILHLRFLFSVFLMPVFFYALSQVPNFNIQDTILTFLIWHLLVYPASNGYNSYFDKDEGSIALIEKPPQVDKSLYYFSLILDTIALTLAICVGWILFFAVLSYGIFSKMYSHPMIRLKKYPVLSFLIVFIFQGAFIYWSTYASVSGLDTLLGWNLNFTIAGLICSCLIGAVYPLTQVYQHEEDSRRGDKTLSLILGIRGSFYFSACLFLFAIILLFIYWSRMDLISNFWLFLVISSPVFLFFAYWFLQVYKNPDRANFRNMTRMTIFSSVMMLIYFGILNII